MPNKIMKEKSSTTTIIDLLRHGELQGDPVFRGSTDDPMTKLGWSQMKKQIKKNQPTQQNWDHILTSPLQRCRLFAEDLGQKQNIPIKTEKRLQEIHFGAWEATSPEEVMDKESEILTSWWDTPTKITPPDGENFLSFRHRILKCWQEILATYEGKHLLITTHAGVIRVILIHILGMLDENLFRLEVDYASFSRIKIYKDQSGEWASLVSHR